MGILRLENLACLEKGMCLYIFYCLCYVKEISTDMLEEQVAEEIDHELNEEEDIILYAIREEHWKDVADEGDNKKIFMP